MNPALAAVTVDTLKYVVLVVLSGFAALAACYCLFFTVKEKAFWARISSLGGGLRGIENHVAGVKEELSNRLDALEKSSAELADALRQQVQAADDRLSKADREAARETDRLRRELQGLQAELREAAAGNARLTQTVETLTNQLRQLRGDLDGLAVELRESVRQQVADSFMSVESTILAALDAVQEEMLYGVNQPAGGPTPLPARRQGARPAGPGSEGERQNIISMGPLFAGVSAQRDADPSEEDDGEAEGEADTASAGATETEKSGAAHEEPAP
jgi:hypothetical protein